MARLFACVILGRTGSPCHLGDRISGQVFGPIHPWDFHDEDYRAEILQVKLKDLGSLNS
jgi:hypothetical protein